MVDVVAHPLDRLSADEIRHVKRILVREGLVTETTRFPWVALVEPDKRTVLDFRPGDPVQRAVRVVALDRATGKSTWLTVSLTEDRVTSTRPVDAVVEGQPPIMLEEFDTVEAIVKNDPDWRKAMANRGIDDVDLVVVCPLSAGNLGRSTETGRRMLRCLSFVRNRPDDAPWAHPVDGLVAFVDLTEGRIIELIDDRVLAVPAEEGNYTPDVIGTMRDTLRPVEITQPDGPSFTVEGDLIRWQNWSFRIGYEAHEGLVLHQVSYQDGERDRPIV
ncbi:MAG TPA: tyramine oxidase, partial [Pseudonocardiaceae bacterium]